MVKVKVMLRLMYMVWLIVKFFIGIRVMFMIRRLLQIFFYTLTNKILITKKIL